MHDHDRGAGGGDHDRGADDSEPAAAPGRTARAAGVIYRDADGAAPSSALASVDAALGAAGQGAAHPSGAILHTDAVASDAAAAMGARAFTAGNDVYFGAGQFNPGTSAGDSLIAHELTHVQQSQGVAPPTPGNFSISDPGQREEVEARSAAAGGEMAPGAAAPATIFRDTDTLGTGVEGALSPLIGHQHAATGGAWVGTASNAMEAKDAGAKDEDPLQKVRAALLASDEAALAAAWASVPKKDKPKLKDETDTLLRMMQVWGPRSLPALREVGVELDTDKRFLQHILWQPDVAAWKGRMSAAQWKDFRTGDPKKQDLDQASLGGLGQAIKATSDQNQAKELFEKAFPPLLTDHTAAENDWWKFQTQSEWTQPRIVRLYNALTGDGLPVGHIAAAATGFLMARHYKTRNLNTDAWPKKWSPLGFGLWMGDPNAIVMPTTSAGKSGGGKNHDMVGGSGADAANPAKATTHWTSSALHEIGHAVGQNIEGNEWARTTGPAGWNGYLNADDAANLTPLSTQAWDASLSTPASTGEKALSAADARAALRGKTATGAFKLPAGWSAEDVEASLWDQHSEQPFFKLVMYNHPRADDAYTSPIEHGDKMFVWLSRWGRYARYEKKAHDEKVSWYSLSSPNEWFAEQYSQYYRTGKSGAGLDPATKTFLDALDSKPYVAPGTAGATPGAADGTPAAGATPVGATPAESEPEESPEDPRGGSVARFDWTW